MSITPTNPVKPNAVASFSTPLHVVTTIIGISAAACAFLFWLVYYHTPTDVTHSHLLFLPALNAVFNTACTVALLIGFRHIWQGRINQHRNAMFVAFLFSCLFLVSYIANHALHGEQRFHGTGWLHPVYIGILITHVFLSIVVLPMILVTFFFSLSGRISMHRRLAHYTFPIWLYVSVTGVIVYAMLAVYH
jgi:putative membrane protein